MDLGTKIKRTRHMRGLSLKQLGLMVGLDEKNAGVRIAQYESNNRKPRPELLKKIAEALEIDYRYLKYSDDSIDSDNLMFKLFDIAENYHLYIRETPDEILPNEFYRSVEFMNEMVNQYLKEWKVRMHEYQHSVISEEEYHAWMMNFPKTFENCGKFKSSVNWRDNPQATDNQE